MPEELGVEIKAYDKASGVLNHVGQRMGILNKQGLAMGVAFAGVNMAMQAVMQAFQAMIQQITQGVQKYRDFEDAIAEVNTMLIEETEHYLPEMKGAVEELSVTWGKSAIDLAQGMYQVLSASVEASKAVRFLGVSTKAAVAGLTSVETAVDGLTTVINAYGLQAEDATRISDIMFQTVKRGKIRFEELAGSMGYVAPIAAQFGIAFEAVAASMATMTKQGIKANMAARTLRMVITSLSAPADQAKTAAMGYGLTLDGLHLSIVGLEGVLDEINNALGDNKTAFADLFPNVRALSGMLALTANDAALFKDDKSDV